MQIPPIRRDGLQLSENRDLLGRKWKIQRLAWSAFALVVVAAIGGVTGAGGYLSSQRLEFGEAVANLPRITRWGASDQAIFEFRSRDSVDLVLGSDFNRLFGVQNIIPEAQESVAMANGLKMTFRLSGDGMKTVRIDLRPSKPGWNSVSVSVDGQTKRTSVLVLP